MLKRQQPGFHRYPIPSRTQYCMMRIVRLDMSCLNVDSVVQHRQNMRQIYNVCDDSMNQAHTQLAALRMLS